MAICKFWQQGNCRFGDQCRFDHPGSNRQQSNRNENRFNALNNNQSQNTGRGGQNRRDNNSQPPYGLDHDIIRADLTSERPIWILSAYGPGRSPPAQLFGGHPREQSFEEMRLRHYELAAQGQEQQALQEAQSLYVIAEEQMKTALQDINGAVRYLVDAERQHPNRIDICQALNDGVAQVPGRNDHPAPSSTPSFSQPANTSLASSSQPAPASNPFAAARSSLQQPSALGNAASNPTFGQPSQPANPFAAAAKAASPFGAASNSTAAFESAARSSNPFAQNPAQSATPFGQSSAPPTANPFAQAREKLSAPAEGSFSGSANTPAPAFGASGFASSGFQSAQPSQTPSTSFGAPAAPPAPASGHPSGGFGAPRSDSQQPTQKNSMGKITSWKGHRVSYIDGDPCFRRQDGEWERIWFPDGPPNAGKAEDLPLALYTSAIEEQYKYLAANKSFKDGLIPELPPQREWTSWDF